MTEPRGRADDERRSPRAREIAALATALVVHGALLLYITESPVRRVFAARAVVPIEIEIVEMRPLPVPPPQQPVEERQERTAAPPRATPPAPVPPPEAAPPEAPPSDAAPPASAPAEAAPPEAVPPAGGSLLRLPKKDAPDATIGRVLGAGQPLGASVSVLASALDVQAEGPMSDGARAAQNAKRALEHDLADDEVTAGLADDYFRALRNHVETSWRPAMKQLNDGGESVTQVGMMKAFVDDRAAWDEMWRTYLHLAEQYAQGKRPKLEPARLERIRELMRSRKGMFRFHAIAEVILTQGPDGKVLTVEMPLSSGHPGIDEGMRDAVALAVTAMADPPPARVHQGRSFTSTWRLRATWTMVPPTALLMGAGFDITSKGLQIDVPFDIKLKTAVLLLRTDAAAKNATGDGDGGGRAAP